ncbi:MAG: hypothetical protein WCN98_21265, partial [Verrucomicrobiaceae bacterium]
MIRSLGIPVEVLDLPLSPERARKAGKIDMEASGYRRPKSSVSIICWNADVLPRIVPELPREIFEDRFIVGIWYWETEILPEEHVRGFDYVDEVWVTSKFLKETIARNAPVPVRYLPHFIRLPQ